MSKKSGQDELSPQEEKVELMATQTIGSILAAMEKKIVKTIEDFVPPDMPMGQAKKVDAPKTEEEKRVEKVNAERLDAFRKAKEKQNAR